MRQCPRPLARLAAHGSAAGKHRQQLDWGWTPEPLPDPDTSSPRPPPRLADTTLPTPAPRAACRTGPPPNSARGCRLPCDAGAGGEESGNWSDPHQAASIPRPLPWPRLLHGGVLARKAQLGDGGGACGEAARAYLHEPRCAPSLTPRQPPALARIQASGQPAPRPLSLLQASGWFSPALSASVGTEAFVDGCGTAGSDVANEGWRPRRQYRHQGSSRDCSHLGHQGHACLLRAQRQARLSCPCPGHTGGPLHPPFRFLATEADVCIS